MDRRDFLKGFGGTVAALGLAGAGTTSRLMADKKALAGHEEVSLKSDLRWGMVIDTRRFTSDADFDRCTSACHEFHNVPRFESLKDEIKWMWKEHYENVFPSKTHQFVSREVEEREYLLLCNHCENPPCVRVCPTKATFKNERNGITMMDWHRCIGCRFCMAACPYGSRSFNWFDPRIQLEKEGRKLNPEFPTRERGVVEKCSFCSEVLELGPKLKPGQDLSNEFLPKCVKASNGSIVFGNLRDEKSRIRQVLNSYKTVQRKPELGTNPSVFYIL
jgi:molybdopterin-containing oxidoreductase family iron-sulfur binding subunit